MRTHKLAALFAALTAGIASQAVELPEIISDNAVLQQKSDAKFWGWSKPGSTVNVTPSWTNDTFMAKTSQDGRWELTVPTPEATFEAQTVTFDDGDGKPVTINDILIGEVWFCSGQSNMEMPLRGFWLQPVEGAAQAIAYSGKYPGIRVATVPKKASYTPESRTDVKWMKSAPENAAEFSALAYFFARSLTDMLNVPVGIISCSYGGSSVEGWMPKSILDTYPGYDMAAEEAKKDKNEWERIGVFYNAMYLPVKDFTVRGILWNQGESNVGRHAEYPTHQRDMVQTWRSEMNGPAELPFYYVEMPPWNYGNPSDTGAAIFRECQHKGVEMIPNSGIVCTTDLVYPYEVADIHARKKQEIGERLAFMAAARTYGIKGVPHTYPRYKSVDLQGEKAVVYFQDAPNGVNPNVNLKGFEVAGEDKVFYPATAVENWNGDSVTLSAPEVKDIKSVRYCFRNFAPGELKDMMGMPLVPFRTDNWEK